MSIICITTFRVKRFKILLLSFTSCITDAYIKINDVKQAFFFVVLGLIKNFFLKQDMTVPQKEKSLCNKI